ncbi:MAG: hypothetical protein KKB50_06805, partial [Planctomycetes bacterium]|nr:hypothetical protein [Planctomycetota bacterium]
MYRLVSVAILCCIFVIDNASGARDIVLLSGNAGKVSIDDYAGTIRITDGDAATFVFECFDDVTGDPADIELIGLSGTPSGTITVAILPGSGHTYGARQVKEIDLTTTGVTGNLAGLNISSHLGQDGDIALDNITGTVAVGGDVLHTIDIGNDITGALKIGGDL